MEGVHYGSKIAEWLWVDGAQVPGTEGYVPDRVWETPPACRDPNADTRLTSSAAADGLAAPTGSSTEGVSFTAIDILTLSTHEMRASHGSSTAPTCSRTPIAVPLVFR